MSKKFGLGKGLDALIPVEESHENQEDLSEKVSKIALEKIIPNKEQPRKNFDEERIMQLGQSIKEHGIIQPIILRKEGELYKIVAGERRYRASKLIGLKEVPAVILEIDDKEVLEISLIENIQRQDLNAIEEAVAYKKLIEDFKLTQEELSSRIGKSRASVTNRMRLLKLDTKVQDYLIDGVISEGHCRTLLAVEDANIQYKLAQRIIDEGLSVRETEYIVKNINKEVIEKQEEKEKDRTEDIIDIHIKDIKLKLEELFGTKVNLLKKKNKGKIEIEYYSEEDLERILDIIKIS